MISNPPIRGILRRPSSASSDSPLIEKKRLGLSNHGNLGSPTSRTGVHFSAPSDLPELLALNNRTQLDGLITHLKNQRGPALVDWLHKIQENLAVLKPKMEFFVLALLNIGWTDQDEDTVTAYNNFLANLVTAQTYYTKPVVKMLVSNFIGVKNREQLEMKAKMVEEEKTIFKHTHEALKCVLKVSPLATKTALLTYCKSCQPYVLTRDTRAHTCYIENLLQLTTYLDQIETKAILKIVIERLLQLDANLPLDYDWEEKEEVAGTSLDQGMTAFLKFVQQHDEKKETLFLDMMDIFETHIMPSYATGHVQFILLYLMGQELELAPVFLERLWKLFCSVNTNAIMRQSAMAYIASFIARASYVSVTTLKMFLGRISRWIHNYLDSRSDCQHDYGLVDLRAHGPFYAACQAVLYLLAFRHEELVHDKKTLTFLNKLRLSRIVTCTLNPLRVCLPPVVKNFAAISRHYQLAYCETVIQRNNRINLPIVGTLASSCTADAKPLLLDTLFPFDPYKLAESKKFIVEMYREYQGGLHDEEEEEEKENMESSSGEDTGDEEEEEDDDDKQLNVHLREVEMSMNAARPPKRRRIDSTGSTGGYDFMYETSPGFKS